MNLKQKPIKVSAITLGARTAVTVDLTGLEDSDRNTLTEALKAIFSSEAGSDELRVDLPDANGQRWSLFFKLKPASKLQLAKPAALEWVASIHLTQERGIALIRGISEKQEVALTKQGALSNLDVAFKG